jgi:glycosyltransferase involved in cell wall biosynthesis
MGRRIVPDPLPAEIGVRIALDATYSIDEGLTGIGVYSRELMLGLAKTHPEARFDYCYRPHRYLRSWKEALPPNARRRLMAEPLGPRCADVFHGLNQRLPRIRLRRSLATFYDLFVMTSDYATPEFRTRFAEQARDAAARADLIVAVSEFTKSQVVGLLNIPASRVRVVHHGIRALEPLPEVAREKIVLNVGTIQERKNIARLVEAFESLDPEWKLVLAGSLGYGAAGIMARIEKSPARGRIAMLGYVSIEDLAGWYARASIFAFPSLDEGFGMPVLEAMAAGVPVITSKRSAMPEVAGDAALLVDPDDVEDIASKLHLLAEDPDARRDFEERGRRRAGAFTWAKAVADTWKLYLELGAG